MNRATCLAAAFFLACSAPALADEGEDAFNAKFGDEYKKVTATPATVDDAALAIKILKEADADGNTPAVAAYCCEKAFELGSKHPTGFAAAAEAMERAADLVPEKRAACWDKLVALRQRQFAGAKAAEKAEAGTCLVDALMEAARARFDAGDDKQADLLGRRAVSLARSAGEDPKEVQARVDQLKKHREIAEKVTDLGAKVQADAKDSASRNELVRLLVVEMDDPKQANLYVDESCDEKLRRYVPKATLPVDSEIPELACTELGKWYEGLAETAALPSSKARMLLRARAYQMRFLEKHGQEDPARSEALIQFKKLVETLNKLGSALAVNVVSPGRCVEILRLTDVSRDVVRGRWAVKEGHLSLLGGEYARVALPCALDGNYEILVRFVPAVEKSDGRVSIYLPVGGSRMSIDFMPSGVRLWRVKEPIPQAAMKVESGQEYSVDAKVKLTGGRALVAVSISDGKALLNWQGAVSEIENDPAWDLAAPKCPGLAGAGATVEFKSVKIRMFDGKARLLR